MESVIQTMINCIADEVCGQNEKIVLPEVSARFLIEVYNLSKAHNVAHLVGDTLNKSGVFENLHVDIDENEQAAIAKVKEKFDEQIFTAVYRYENINYELERLKETLEEAKIPFIPLKGSVIRKYYPEPWMRTSCDIDILVREEDLKRAKKAICEKLGYKMSSERTQHDITLYSTNGVHLELHYTLIEDDSFPKADRILDKCWDYAYNDGDREYLKSFKDSFFYFYHILHMAKHIKGGGCGVRPFLDLWILNHNEENHESERNELLSESGIQKFAKVAEIISEKWFSLKANQNSGIVQTNEENKLIEELSDYVINGGVYGTTKNRVAVQRADKSKTGYFLSRIFLPYRDLSMLYPNLEKHKVLFPFYEIRRWCSIVFGGRLKKGMSELSENSKVTQEDCKKMKNLLDELELQD